MGSSQSGRGSDRQLWRIFLVDALDPGQFLMDRWTTSLMKDWCLRTTSGDINCLAPEFVNPMTNAHVDPWTTWLASQGAADMDKRKTVRST